MKPTFSDGDEVVAIKKWLFPIRVNDIVVATSPNSKRILIKRVKKRKNDLFFLVGDNLLESADSRRFGWIEKKDIIGKVIAKI